MASIEKRNGKYRVRYRDPFGRSEPDVHAQGRRRPVRSRGRGRHGPGRWIDPRKSDISLQEWSETFLSSSLSLSPTSLQTYRRDPRPVRPPGPGRPASVPPERRGDRAVARHRARPRHLAVIGPSPLPDVAPRPGSAVEKDRLLVNPCAKVRPPRVPIRPMAILTWSQSVALAESHPPHLKPMIYLALDSGMRWSELVGLRRGQVDLARRKVRVTEQLLQVDASGSAVPPRRLPGSDRSPSPEHRRAARGPPR